MLVKIFAKYSRSGLSNENTFLGYRNAQVVIINFESFDHCIFLIILGKRVSDSESESA